MGAEWVGWGAAAFSGLFIGMLLRPPCPTKPISAALVKIIMPHPLPCLPKHRPPTPPLLAEDALGDRDFKVAGDEGGITALQMDIKVEGITLAIMGTALAAARAGRTHILGEMRK